MKFSVALLCAVILAAPAHAVDAPAAQAPISNGQILRGHFTELRQKLGDPTPMQTAGHFTVAPGFGLIWGIEQPFPTSTIVTPNGVAQEVGGMALKMPMKNLAHIFDMVGGALAGHWDALESDYVITPGGSAAKWQMVLTPRPDAPHKVTYSSITVSGGKFVENIAMLTANGTSDVFAFSDGDLATSAPTPQEAKLYAAAGR